MPASTYWQRTIVSRLSRRRALTGVAGAGLGAVALSALGCGGSGSSSGSSPGEAGLVSKPLDTTSQAKAGGTLRHFATADPAHFDPLLSSNANVVNFVSPYAYPRLIKWVSGTYPKTADGSIEGFAAESFEVSPDKLQLMFKLRQMKWDSRAPTNNRPLDAQDVVFSWNKFGQANLLRSNLIYDARSAALAPGESISAPDSRTVVIKLRQPDSRVMPILAAYDYLNIMPREADGGFDPKKDVRGHGPWMMESYTPSVGIIWKKNPDYYIKDRPFPDRLEIPIVPDHAQQLAQFKAGNIYTNVTTAADVLQTKRDAPEAVLQQGLNFRAAGGGYVSFGWENGSPWADVRLRQAMSMAIDRQAYADTIENRDTFRKEGLDLPVKFNSIVYAAWTGYYLDPDDEKAFGSNAKYLQMNVAEAKKLVSAAGHPNGLEFEWVYSTEQYGAEYLKTAQVLAGMFPEVGLKPKQLALPYQTYQQRYTDVNYWNFGGVICRAGRAWPSLAQNLFAFTNPKGTNYHGASTDGKNLDQGDARLTGLVDRLIGEFDVKKQQEIAHEVIRYYTQQVYSISRPSNTPGYTLAWPVIGNVGLNSTYVGGSAVDPWLNWWIDSSKPPVGKA
jgi:ABC-type transport system substrate-binding protein